MTSGTGTCTVHYNQAGNDNYNAAPEKTEDVTAEKANQTITITTPAPASKVFNTSFTVAATASSGLAVSYSASGVCSNVGATFTMTSGTGTCTVHYNQAGNDNYNAAPEKTEDVTAEKADQTITITTPAPASKVFNTSFTVAATASSGLAVSYSASGVCSNVGATFTMTSGTGTCTVHYNQAGNDNYNAAPEKTEDVTAEKADQTITITTPAPATQGLRHLLHGRRHRQLAGSPSATAPAASAATSGHVHDDERHRHLHRPLQPGRQRQLQRRAREDRRRHRREGQPDDHDHHPGAGDARSSTPPSRSPPPPARAWRSATAPAASAATSVPPSR